MRIFKGLIYILNKVSGYDDEFYHYLFEANRRLLENYYDNLKEKMIETAKKLYLERDETFRGFRQI